MDSRSQGDDRYLLHFGRTPRRCTLPDLLLHAPTSLEEASQILARYQGEARAIAGGTALVLMLHQGLIRPPALVRLDRVQEMNGISVEDGTLRIGALATLRDVAASPLVAERLPVLASACKLVANVRVRNAATVGGNLAEADYASDPPGVLVANLPYNVATPVIIRALPTVERFCVMVQREIADRLFASPGTKAYGAVSVLVQLACERLGRRPNQRMLDARVAVGAVAGKPLRLPEVEAIALGQIPSDDLFREIGSRYAASVDPVGDVRGSAEYRKDMVAVFVRRALHAAAGGEAGARKV